MAALVVEQSGLDFEDYFPTMMETVGLEGLVGELCTGFRLLMDVEKGVITFESLKRNSYLLGLHDMADDEFLCMLKEGDLNGDGWLDQTEFCVLMFRLSPALMDLATTYCLVDLAGGAATAHAHQYASV